MDEVAIRAARRRSLWRGWLGRLGPGRGRGPRINRIDPQSAPADLLRDIGLSDGRGPSLRRPERAPDPR
ncbi:hypothetical protein [Labrys wisconsinensis]|uniref:DUF1127 domain-containing protein n=1 Tax=Labrys wisconsinensis TaxID=425677 RepID=A0ABU0JHL2_9HYPH|nr:hypothetical protein [Labrys wisconsinensis]MDQ0472981.1 hypothetical protein [Labrys wisconsinensis]